MKIISMYLPQFHRIKENDEWWGEGFTEWTTVKNAEILYENHNQPRVPLNNNYYNLLDKSTMQWQADLMKQYGIDGQCFYHYWFKDGRQILEKPAENLLKWKDIDMPYCFCWANESWTRTWSKGEGNSWAGRYEVKDRETGTAMLLEQDYGEEEQWRQHFEYLLHFFNDDRYIKKDNKPIFVIYKSALIPCLGSMLEKWQQWAIESGFAGLYIIGANSNHRVEKSLDALLYHQPQYATGMISVEDEVFKDDVLTMDYDKLWDKVLNGYFKPYKAIYGGFVGYDDSPRHGNMGLVVENDTPQKFQQYLTELIAKNIANNNDLIFINAWNEWGEGMYLEPDEEYGYAYLEAVKYAREHYVDYINKYEMGKSSNTLNELNVLGAKCDRYKSYWEVLDKWLTLKENGTSLEKYFSARNISNIAVYGLGMLGRHLLKELEDTAIEVKYAIDRNPKVKSDSGIRIYSCDDSLPQVGVIVVTAVYDFVAIKDMLKQLGYENVISLEDVLAEI